MNEEEFVQAIMSLEISSGAGVHLGVGDDCALIEPPEGCRTLLSTDVLAEGVHFLMDSCSAYQLGRKSIAVNLSDVAAMGGKAHSVLLSLSLPPSLSSEWCQEYLCGVKSICKEYGVALIGGDTTASKSHLFLSVTVVGYAHPGKVKKRDAAQPGDLLGVTGPLGASSFVFRHLHRPDLDRLPHFQTMREHWCNPRPHLLEAHLLSECTGVRALMDMSDGLAQDLSRMCKASACHAEVDVDKVPLGLGLIEMSEHLGEVAVDHAISGGEDYCLLFSIDPQATESLIHSFQESGLSAPQFIGQMVSGQSDGVSFFKDKQRYHCSLATWTWGEGLSHTQID